MKNKVILTPMSKSVNNGKVIEKIFVTSNEAYEYFCLKCDELGYQHGPDKDIAGGIGHDYRIELSESNLIGKTHKHTPAPWVRRDLEIIGPYKSNKHICEITGNFMSEEEAEANAKLITAAPELLEAVREYLRIIDDEGCIPDIEQIKLTDLMIKARNKAIK